MKKIKQKYYQIFIYPKFIKNIKKVLSENNILMRIKFEEDKAIVYYFLEDKLITIEKPTIGILSYTETTIDNIITREDLPEYIKDLKLNAEIISAQNLIDFIFNTFKEAISYYKFTRKEYQTVYEVVLKNQDFFKYNTPATVIHNEGIKNKWID